MLKQLPRLTFADRRRGCGSLGEPNFISAFQAASRRIRLDFENGWAELDPAFAYSGLQMKVTRKVSPQAEDVAV